MVDEFTKGVGARLHQAIVDRDKSQYSSYISKPWFDMYLENRDPLMLNINPQITFISDPNPAKMEQAVRAATLIWSSARFYRTLVDGQLEPDMFHTKVHTSIMVKSSDRELAHLLWLECAVFGQESTVSLGAARRATVRTPQLPQSHSRRPPPHPPPFGAQACMGGSGEGFFRFLNGRGGDDTFKTFCSLLPRRFAFYGAYVYGTYPLDLSQYSGLFQSTRIPVRRRRRRRRRVRCPH